MKTVTLQRELVLTRSAMTPLQYKITLIMKRLEELQAKPLKKTIYIDEKGRKHYPANCVTTILKFHRSDKSGHIVSFVSQNCKTGQVRGVAEDSSYPKQVCVLDKKLTLKVEEGRLYRTWIVPMSQSKGFIAIDVELWQFPAKIDVVYEQDKSYKAIIRYGNQQIVFDPKDGVRPTNNLRGSNTIFKTLKVLETRDDIKNLNKVIEKFKVAAETVLKHYIDDGYDPHTKSETAA